MEQRPLRLGDVIDDYCPRERRVTNHAVVAIVEDVIRQTRCTTCDEEHPYKGAREPRLRRKPAAELYDQVLADVTGSPPVPPGASEPDSAPIAAAPSADPAPPADVRAEEESPAQEPGSDGWTMHRQLIRATLPRTDSDPPPPRPIPEFTMHQRQARGSRAFRHAGGNANGNVNGNAGGRHGYHGHGFGGPGGNRHGKHSGRRHRGGKRSR